MRRGGYGETRREAKLQRCAKGHQIIATREFYAANLYKCIDILNFTVHC